MNRSANFVDGQMSKVVLVCGASGGLGEVVASTLQSKGMTVFGTMRNPSNAQATYSFPMLPLDVTSEESVKTCVEQVMAQSGRVDVVINCFNDMMLGTVEETTIEEVEDLYNINLFGVVRMCRAVLPIMRAQKSGTIINMSSLGGLIAAPYLSAYTSAKFAIEAFSEALYHELRKTPIDVVIMQPVAMYMDRPATGSHLRGAKNLAPDSLTHKMIEKMAQDTLESKLTPQMVADEIHKVIGKRRKKLRYPMDRAKALTKIKRFAPQSVINRMIDGLVPA